MSILILLILLLLTTLLFLIKKKHLAYGTLIFSLIYIISIASGLLPHILLTGLQKPCEQSSIPIWKNNNVIILLGAGTVLIPSEHLYLPNNAGYTRIQKAAELYWACKKTRHTCHILISGGPIQHTEKSDALVYEKAMIKLGLPLDDFILELYSKDTETNAKFSSALVKQDHFDRVILVTSTIHMKRSLMWFHFFGLDPAAESAGYLETKSSSPGNNFAVTDLAIHEYLGMIEVSIRHSFR